MQPPNNPDTLPTLLSSLHISDPVIAAVTRAIASFQTLPSPSGLQPSAQSDIQKSALGWWRWYSEISFTEENYSEKERPRMDRSFLRTFSDLFLQSGLTNGYGIPVKIVSSGSLLEGGRISMTQVDQYGREIVIWYCPVAFQGPGWWKGYMATLVHEFCHAFILRLTNVRQGGYVEDSHDALWCKLALEVEIAALKHFDMELDLGVFENIVKDYRRDVPVGIEFWMYFHENIPLEQQCRLINRFGTFDWYQLAVYCHKTPGVWELVQPSMTERMLFERSILRNSMSSWEIQPWADGMEAEYVVDVFRDPSLRDEFCGRGPGEDLIGLDKFVRWKILERLSGGPSQI